MSSDERSIFSPDGRARRDDVREQLSRRAATLVAGNRPTEDMQQWQPSLADKAASLGFVGEATSTFDLLPLVLVAWADGTIQSEERGKILDVLRLRGVAEGKTFTMFEALLEQQPAEVYLEAALDVLRGLVAEQADGGASVVDLCIEVAAAAGDTLGSSDPISTEEREAIARIAQALGPAAHAELHRRLGAGS